VTVIAEIYGKQYKLYYTLKTLYYSIFIRSFL